MDSDFLDRQTAFFRAHEDEPMVSGPDRGDVPDVRVVPLGTLTQCYLDTRYAREWVDEHVVLESYMQGPDYFLCEPRYVGDILTGMQADGLVVEVLGARNG